MFDNNKRYMERYVGSKEASIITGLSRKTLANRRSAGKPPEFTKPEGMNKPVYWLPSLLEFMRNKKAKKEV